MEPFDERILSYLRERRGEPHTAYQVANAMGTAGAGMMLAKPFKTGEIQGYAVGIHVIRMALERLVESGLVRKRMEGGLIKEAFYYIE